MNGSGSERLIYACDDISEVESVSEIQMGSVSGVGGDGGGISEGILIFVKELENEIELVNGSECVSESGSERVMLAWRSGRGRRQRS